MKKVLITFKVPDDTLRQLHYMLEKGNYDSRSDLIRAVLAEFLKNEYFHGEVPKEKAELFEII